MVGFKEESKEVIEEFIKEGYLEDDIITSIWKARSKADIKKILINNLSLDRFDYAKAIGYFSINEWGNAEILDKDWSNESTCFIINLCKHNGIINNKELIASNLTIRQIKVARKELNELGFISELTFSNSEILYILHPKYIKRMLSG